MIVRIKIALLGAYLFTECYIGVCMKKGSIKCYRTYQRTFFLFLKGGTKRQRNRASHAGIGWWAFS